MRQVARPPASRCLCPCAVHKPSSGQAGQTGQTGQRGPLARASFWIMEKEEGFFGRKDTFYLATTVPNCISLYNILYFNYIFKSIRTFKRSIFCTTAGRRPVNAHFLASGAQKFLLPCTGGSKRLRGFQKLQLMHGHKRRHGPGQHQRRDVC